MIDEKNFEYQIRSLASKIEPSEEAILKVKSLNRNSKRTKIGKKIYVINLVTILLCIFATPIVVFATYNISTSLYEKVKNANLSQMDMEQLDKQLQEEGFSNEQINELHELNINESGQTYGPDALGADLIEVIADDGQFGYIYRTDFEQLSANDISDAILNSGKEEALTVYKNDGKTKIGTFTLTDGKIN